MDKTNKHDDKSSNNKSNKQDSKSVNKEDKVKKPIRIDIIVIGVIFIIAIITFPFIMECGAKSKRYSPLSNADWSSFFGSYIGGVVGGVGALIAVYISTSQVKLYEEKKKKAEITENALVIYYDMKFAFCEIYKKLSTVNRQLVISGKELENVFIDENWIHTVAKVAPSLEPKFVKQLYNLYGHIEILKSCNDLDRRIPTITTWFYENKKEMVEISDKVFKELVRIIDENGNIKLSDDNKQIPGYRIYNTI